MLTSTEQVVQILKLLQKNTKYFPQTAAAEIVRQYGRNPFLILISCILSLRTKDTVSLPASLRLFKRGVTPSALLDIPCQTIEKLVYPVSFYRQKTKQIHIICKQLLNDFSGKVPAAREDLLSLTGVGPKTANLVLSEGFSIPALCVDTHVHRITNRLGWIRTKTPEETEVELKKIVPSQYWIQLNSLLVRWGQNHCVPISPFCSVCPLKTICPADNVIKSR